jgi:hypothetical protein
VSVTVITEGETIRVPSGGQSLPEGRPVILFTCDELKRMIETQIWAQVPPQTREDMMFQTQSASYQEWISEDHCDSATAEATSAMLPLVTFRP